MSEHKTYLEEWKVDSVISDDLGNSSVKLSLLHSKYLEYLSMHKMRLIKLNNDYTLLRKYLVRYFNGQATKQELEEYKMDPYQHTKPLKAELEGLINAHEEVSAIIQKQEYNENCIYILESIMKQLAANGFNIKNKIEYEKFKAGY